jgi:VCBS repeat-containing protein
MAKIKMMALAGVLALTMLVAASVPASASGRAVAITGHGTGTIRLDAATGAFTGAESGVSSVLGTYTVHLQGQATLAADGTVAGIGTATIVAANGDQLTGDFTVTGDGQTQTVVVTITGGTGRFKNATGTLTVICDAGPAHQEGAVLVLEHKCTMNGTASY